MQILGLDVYAVGDCLRWKYEKSHRRALKRMRDFGARCRSSERSAGSLASGQTSGCNALRSLRAADCRADERFGWHLQECKSPRSACNSSEVSKEDIHKLSLRVDQLTRSTS